jgi:hypothetical protein
MAADEVVSAAVVVRSVVVGSAVVVSVVKSVVAEAADVSTVMDESDVSAEEADVSAEDTDVSVDDPTTVEEEASPSSVVDATEVANEVSVEVAAVTATEMAPEVVVAETNLISVLNQLTLPSINTHEACKGLRQQSQWPIGRTPLANE